MKRVFGAALTVFLTIGPAIALRADEKDATATIDKAIKALGGEDKLTKAQIVTWKQKGTVTFGGNDNEMSFDSTYKGLDHYRVEFKGNFNDNEVGGTTLVNADKGWTKFGDMDHDMEEAEIANEKRRIYLAIIPTTMVQLKGKDFKSEAAGEEKVGDKPALVVKVTCPDGKDFKISFDKESGLPVKLVAQVVGFGGEEYVQETTFTDYKDIDGIKKATKVESKRDGEKFINMQVSDFKVLDKVDDAIFSKPK
jgi:hypothetical protein